MSLPEKGSLGAGGFFKIDLSANLLSSDVYFLLFNSNITAARVSKLNSLRTYLNISFCSAIDCPNKSSLFNSFLINSCFKDILGLVELLIRVASSLLISLSNLGIVSL